MPVSIAGAMGVAAAAAALMVSAMCSISGTISTDTMASAMSAAAFSSSAFTAGLAAAFPAAFFGGCALHGWPAAPVVSKWPLKGSRERCFCAYTALGAGGEDSLGVECPSWPYFVSTDGLHPDRVSQAGRATVMGKLHGNATAARYGYVGDWAVDLGSGWNRDCNRTLSPHCEAVGAHVLSIPRDEYLHDCCTHPTLSLVAHLKDIRTSGLCELLRDLVGGALPHVNNLARYRACRHENEEPTADTSCLAQCFHIVPDVFYLHLHTTAGVARLRTGPVNSGLGPAFNASEAHDPATAYGRYNLCVCEPKKWAASAPGRGFCPLVAPSNPDYVNQATISLCRNLAGVAEIDPKVCEFCQALPASPLS